MTSVVKTSVDPEEELNEGNVAAWVERKLRDIEDRYKGHVYSVDNHAKVIAEIKEVAAKAEAVVGVKVAWSVDIVDDRVTTPFSNRYSSEFVTKPVLTDRQLIRQRALAKLTPEEIDALNLEHLT